MRVDEPLSARDLREIKRRLERGVESADVRDHHLRMEQTLADPVDGIGHVLHVAAGVGDDMVVHVVDVVEVEHGGKLLVRRPREEVEASAEGEQVRALRDERGNCREEEDVVIAAASRSRVRGVDGVIAVQRLEIGDWIFHVLRIDKTHVDAVHLPGDNQPRWPFIALPRCPFIVQP